MCHRSKGAKLAFAVHAFFLAEGYKPVAVGKRADEAAPGDASVLAATSRHVRDILAASMAVAAPPTSWRIHSDAVRDGCSQRTS